MNLVRKNGPFMESKLSTSKIMRNIFIALIPIILFTFYTKGIITFQKNGNIIDLFWIFITLLITTATSFIIEMLFQIIFIKRRKKEDILFDIKHNYSFMTGLIVGLLLPYGTNILIMVIASMSATVIGKLLFGGFGNNTFNPALIGILIAILLFGGSIAKMSHEYNYQHECNNKEEINLCINENHNYNLNDIIVGKIAGSPADICSLICIASLIFLIITKSIKWRIPIFYITTAFILYILLGIKNGNILDNGIYHLFTGGLLFYAVFISSDSVTTPVTKLGQLLLGISLGILTVLFRELTPYYYESTIFSILVLNLFTKLFDTIALNYKKKKLIILIPTFILAILSISIFII